MRSWISVACLISNTLPSSGTPLGPGMSSTVFDAGVTVAVMTGRS